jgi:hypothetical protein
MDFGRSEPDKLLVFLENSSANVKIEAPDRVTFVRRSAPLGCPLFADSRYFTDKTAFPSQEVENLNR